MIDLKERDVNEVPMTSKKPAYDPKKVDTKEFDIPETLFVRDIENQVFQGIVLQTLAKISGVSLLEDNFIETLLGKNPVAQSYKGILAEQDAKSNTIRIRIDLNVQYGVSIPEKAEEIQSKVAEEITKLTGLHVSQVHLVFKNIVTETAKPLSREIEARARKALASEEDYNDEF
jgi:uncharacterized alkaline shock family protein YloU